MAKKEKKSEEERATTPTIVEMTARRVASRAFEDHAELQEVHVTADGQGFYTLTDARSHARILEDHTVTSVRRDDPQQEEPRETGDVGFAPPGEDNETENGEA